MDGHSPFGNWLSKKRRQVHLLLGHWGAPKHMNGLVVDDVVDDNDTFARLHADEQRFVTLTKKRAAQKQPIDGPSKNSVKRC